jgi:hypothetical protein
MPSLYTGTFEVPGQPVASVRITAIEQGRDAAGGWQCLAQINHLGAAFKSSFTVMAEGRPVSQRQQEETLKRRMIAGLQESLRCASEHLRGINLERAPTHSLVLTYQCACRSAGQSCQRYGIIS